MYQFQTESTGSLLQREEKPVCCLSQLEYSWRHMLISIMGVLVLTLGIILIIYNSFHRVAFSAGICLTVASLIFVALSHVQVGSNSNEGSTEGSEAESSLYTFQTLELASTRL